MRDFIADIFRSKTGVSSKRVFGSIGFVSAIVFIGVWERDLTDLLLITSASLLGLETISGIFTPKTKK